MLIRLIHNGDAGDFGGAKCLRDVLDRIFGEFDDVDLFAAQLTNDGLHAHALHSHACTDAIDVAIAAKDRNFRALTSFPSARFDRDRVVVNLRNFLFKEPHNQFGGRTRDQHTRVLTAPVDALDDAAHAVTDTEAFHARLFFLRQARFGLAHVNDVILAFQPLDDAVHQFAVAPLKLGVNAIPFGFPDFLQNDLLRGLSGNSSQCLGRLRLAHFTADFRFAVEFAGGLKRDLLERLIHRLRPPV